jgi:hypothetical protein
VHPDRSSPPSASIELAVERLQQPDELTCGPTSLLQLYRYYGFSRTLDQVIKETRCNPDGGTLAVYLGLSALANGFTPAIYSYNFAVFDPTWRGLEPPALVAKLRERSEWVESERLRRIILAYAELVTLGGEVRFDELGRDLVVDLLHRNQPILTGLSATYLYGAARELDEIGDDVRGDPVGHFVVISGYDASREELTVCDPSIHTPFTPTGRYRVAAERLIVSIVLGGATDDAVLLVLGPSKMWTVEPS